MSETLYYLDAFTDEVMPCQPTLEAWAEWLSEPDAEYGHEAACEDGAEFEASTIQLLGDVRADPTPGGGWRFTPAIPDGAQFFYCRWGEGSRGWDAERSGDTPEDALCEEDRDEPVWLACTRDGPSIVVRFEAATDERPARCVVVEKQ